MDAVVMSYDFVLHTYLSDPLFADTKTKLFHMSQLSLSV
jgi:hypothetical protein